MKKFTSNILVFFITLTVFLSSPGYSQEVPEISDVEIANKIQEEAKDLDVINLPIRTSEEEIEKEDCENPDANKNLIDLTKNIVKDTGSILIAPAGWTKEEWIKASAIVAGLAMISTQDLKGKEFSQSLRNDTTEKISHGLEKVGNGAPALAALGATYVTSLLIKDEKLKNVSLTAVESMAIAAVLTTLGKQMFHRERPYSTTSQYNFHGPALTTKNLSFPSGHTGSAFAIATVFAEAYGDSKIAPLLAYSAATLAGLSRIHDNKHWISDVVGGAILGYAAGKFVSNKRLNNGSHSKVKVTPSVALGHNSSFEVAVRIPIVSNKKKRKQRLLDASKIQD